MMIVMMLAGWLFESVDQEAIARAEENNVDGANHRLVGRHCPVCEPEHFTESGVLINR